MQRRYVRRPEPVTAERFVKDREPWPEYVEQGNDGVFRMLTPSGPFVVKSGNWIITHENGVMVSMTDDMFQMIYEPAE